MESIDVTAEPKSLGWRIVHIFHPAPPAAVMIDDPIDIREKSRYWRRRILIGTIVGYAVFYLVRTNLGIAMPAMHRSLGISQSDLGLFLTLSGWLYGLSKFLNGMVGDRANARFFMAAGLLCSALLNISFGFSSTVLAMGIVWMLNGWFQGMGFPPCARLLSHWFTSKELVTKFSIWNASHSIGAIVILVLGGYLAERNWRLCFFVPAGIAIACAIYVLITLRDTPESLGLPPIHSGDSRNSSDEESNFWPMLVKFVFTSKYIWLLSLANFFVYAIRYTLLDWSPTLLSELKGFQLRHAGWMTAGFEAAGACGALLGGWLTDRYLKGRAARVCGIYMLLCAVSIWAFWKLPGQSKIANTALLCTTGFLVYGPQCLLAALVVNLASKRAAATAVGLTGIFGYASKGLSGWGIGMLVERGGWDRAFQALIAVAIVATIIFAFTWNARAAEQPDD